MGRCPRMRSRRGSMRARARRRLRRREWHTRMRARWRLVQSVRPVWHLPVPWTIKVIVRPVGSERKTNDANSDHCAIVQYRNVRPLMGVQDIFGVHPAPAHPGIDIAPTVVAQAPEHGHRDPGLQDGDHRILAGGPGPDVDALGRVGKLGQRCHRNDGHDHDEAQYGEDFHCFGRSMGQMQPMPALMRSV